MGDCQLCDLDRGGCTCTAADFENEELKERIETLEAKLRKAVEALEAVQHWMADARDEAIPCCFPRKTINEALKEYA